MAFTPIPPEYCGILVNELKGGMYLYSKECREEYQRRTGQQYQSSPWYFIESRMDPILVQMYIEKGGDWMSVPGTSRIRLALFPRECYETMNLEFEHVKINFHSCLDYRVRNLVQEERPADEIVTEIREQIQKIDKAKDDFSNASTILGRLELDWEKERTIIHRPIPLKFERFYLDDDVSGL